MKGPNKFQQKNQFQLVLSDNLGKWTGTGVSNLVSFQEPFLQNLKLAKGEYIVEFNQNMRDEKLKDVNNVGIQVVRGQLIL
jgi:gliding motility-associated lipoprotein GldH